MAETVEVLQRSWHVEGQSVRPDHRMVAHTGFLTSARLLRVAGGRGPPDPGGRADRVNLLDLIVIVVGACWPPSGGYRLGFLARVTSWIGLALGLYVAAGFLPRIVNAPGRRPSRAAGSSWPPAS